MFFNKSHSNFYICQISLCRLAHLLTMSRNASHAGSWYSGTRNNLLDDMEKDLIMADQFEIASRVVIAPHAGYSHCSTTQAHSFKNLQDSNRVVILGPSHFFPLKDVALPHFRYLETPINGLQVDTNSIQELHHRGFNLKLDEKQDLKEHSIEMELPWLAHLQPKTSIVPLLIGKLDAKKQHTLSLLLKEWYQDPKTAFVISSDFCHWGDRFGYTYLPGESGEISKGIEKLDKMSTKYLDSGDLQGFHKYLVKTKNTICGRDSIELMLNVMSNPIGKLLHYSQSGKVKSESDSSVSYMSYSFYE